MSTPFKLILVAGARPNFMKIAPLMHALEDHPTIHPILVHTGQHYDEAMSDSFFKQLNIPEPDINLEVGSASHAVQTARIMESFERVCLDIKPDMVLVVGDVNSTAACSLVASKLHIRVAHYEAGLRSNDRTMPEEINRLVTDAITDLYLTTSDDASENLFREGIPSTQVHMVGNLMIDSLVSRIEQISSRYPKLAVLDGTEVDPGILDGPFALMTFHRPSNVDHKDALTELVSQWRQVADQLPIIFPAHPRTQKMLNSFQLWDELTSHAHIYLTGPLSYLDFMGLVQRCKLVITDSGGIQEETTYLGIPCLTVRPNTERPITIWEGSNQLITSPDIIMKVNEILTQPKSDHRCPKFWDGETALRIVEILESLG